MIAAGDNTVFPAEITIFCKQNIVRTSNARPYDDHLNSPINRNLFVCSFPFFIKIGATRRWLRNILLIMIETNRGEDLTGGNGDLGADGVLAGGQLLHGSL